MKILSVLLLSLLSLSACQTTTSTPSIRQVNADINKVSYVKDMENYGKSEFWAYPKEFYKNGGDCEDYAIAKYYKLQELELAKKEDMRLIIMKNPRGIPHAVLLVGNYILDNETNKILHIKELNQARVYGYIDDVETAIAQRR